MSLPILDISSELFPAMSPAMRDVRQVVASVDLVSWAFPVARAGVIQPVMKDTHQHFSVHFAIGRSGWSGQE